MPDRLGPRQRLVAAALLFLLLSAALNRELLPHLASALPGNAGDPMLNAWILGWVSDALVTSPATVWHAPIFHPHSHALAFSEHLVGIAAFVAPVYWLTADPILTYNVAFLLGFAFLGWAAFVLVRALTGRDDAALVVGALLLCSPYFASSQVARLQMLSAGWSLLTWRWLQAWLASGLARPLAAAVGCWALQFASNIYLGLFLAGTMVVLVAVGYRRQAVAARPRLRPLLAALVVMGAIAAPVLSQYSRVRTDLGLTHSDDEVERYSATVRAYASVWHERQSRWLWAESASDRALFPGWTFTVLGLTGAAALLARRRQQLFTAPAAAYAVIGLLAFVVTLGPAPAIGDHPLGVPSPYAWLLEVVPGVDGIRAPGRFAVFVLLTWSVLAGAGAAALLAGRGHVIRAAVATALLTLAVIEGHRDYDWLAMLPVEQPSATAAYTWLAAQPRGAVVEMPIVTDFQSQRPYAGGSVTLRYQLAALRHGQPLVNGSSGFVTPLVTLLQGHASPFTTLDTVDDALRVLRAIGTRYLVSHRHEYRPETHGHLDAVLQTMRADAAQVEAAHDFGTTSVLVLRAAPRADAAPRRERIPRPQYVVSASTDAASHALLTDDDPDTRWRAPQDGAAWIEVRFARARVVRGVKLDVARSAVADYPHHLRVIGTDPGGASHVLFDGPAVYDAAMTAVFEPAAPGLRIQWPPLALARVRLEQPVPAGDRQWSIHELHVLGEAPLTVDQGGGPAAPALRPRAQAPATPAVDQAPRPSCSSATRTS